MFGAVTTGAADDLHRVEEISRSMIHEYAMGTSITSRKVPPRAARCPTARVELRDDEQQHLADEAMRWALRILTEHRASSTSSASALLRNEVLERKDIDRIMEGVPTLRSRGSGSRAAGRRRDRAGRPAASKSES